MKVTGMLRLCEWAVNLFFCNYSWGLTGSPHNHDFHATKARQNVVGERRGPSLSFAKTQSCLCFQSSPLGRSPFISVAQSTDLSDLDHCP